MRECRIVRNLSERMELSGWMGRAAKWQTHEKVRLQGIYEGWIFYSWAGLKGGGHEKGWLYAGRKIQEFFIDRHSPFSSLRLCVMGGIFEET